MTTTVTLPCIIKIHNVGDKLESFAPYRENFQVNLAAGATIEFEVNTAGQYFYYVRQATKNLEVSQISEFDTESATLKVIDLPAIVTLTNISSRVKGFVPYHENFQVDMEPEDVIKLECTTIGQVLYYLAQADADLTVTEEAKA